MKNALIVLSFSLFSIAFGENKEYFFQDITSDSEITFGSIKTLSEDANGFLWFGCDNGLYYHNTIGITKYNLYANSSNNSQSIVIYKIYKDDNNDLWVCSEDGLFKRSKEKSAFEKKQLNNTNITLKRNPTIEDILQIDKNKYLLLIDKFLYLYSENTSSLTEISIFNKRKINGTISCIKKESDNTLLVGTTKGRVFITTPLLKEIGQLYSSGKNIISAICKDGNKYYIGTRENGVDIINTEGIRIDELNTNQTGKQHIIDNHISQIIKTENNEIWISSLLGLEIIDDKSHTLIESNTHSGLIHRSIFSMTKGKYGGVWIGSYAGGVSYYRDCNYFFKNIAIDYTDLPNNRSTVSSFTEDAEQNIWIGSEDDGNLTAYNLKENKFITIPSAIKQKMKSIKSIEYVGNNTIAIGRMDQNTTLYNSKTNTLDYKIKNTIPEVLSSLCQEYNENDYWVAGRKEVYHYDLRTGQHTRIFTIQIAYPKNYRIWKILLDTSHNLWICSDAGLFVKTQGSDEVKQCFANDSVFKLNNNTIYTICENNNGNMWIGTKGRGVFSYSLHNDSIKEIPDYALTKKADIFSLIKDKKGGIWYNTNQGLYYYTASSNETSHFTTIDRLPNSQVGPNSAFCSSTGILLFGSINGFSIVNPDLIKKNKIKPKVFLSRFSINNKPLSSNNSVCSNSLNLAEIKKVVLDPEYNTLSFKVVTNNFIKSEKNKFRYRLQNYDDKWIEIGQDRYINFTKVPSGKYLLEVYGSNNDKVWSEKPYVLEIRIRPPYWRRWYAILLYITLLTTILTLIFKELESKLKLRREIADEKQKSQTNALIYAERVKFFTNISHEFRTPLSLILSPLKTLELHIDKNTKARDLLNVAYRNAKRLLKLADQSLDFRLLEVGQLKPTFEKTDLIELATDVYHCFEQQIIEKQINFSFSSNFKKLELIIDADMVEKIIYNLMSNAMKYTPEKGYVFISIEQRELTEESYEGHICSGDPFYGDAIEIMIRDNGRGIKAQMLPHIFERFAKGKDKHENSSGIGLHLCKEYSAMNDGNIIITSNEGIGSTFILNLPIKEKGKYEKMDQKQVKNQEFIKNHPPLTNNIEGNNDVPIKTILVVEDNDELRSYLRNLLNTDFKVLTAPDGLKALNIIIKQHPDMVLTDVSMPNMTGIELTQKIKENVITQNIPVIVMTAHTERTFQMESILKGADAFLTKPVEDALLLAQINNLWQKFNKKDHIDFDENINDDSLINQISKYIQDNLQNQEFGIQNILTEFRISKSTLDRRVKSESGQNPTGLIRDLRLKNAIKLMKTMKFNIDEIATCVGFNSTSYFIRSFKKKYNQTPNEFMQKFF